MIYRLKLDCGIKKFENHEVRASASKSVNLGFTVGSLVESCQKTIKNGIHSSPVWLSVQMR